MYVYLFVFILKKTRQCFIRENNLYNYNTFTHHIDQYDY